MDRSLRHPHPWLIVGFGAALFITALVHHGRELAVVGSVNGPLAAVVLDGVPALGLAYLGYWLSGRGFSGRDHRLILAWCLGGSALFVAVIGATYLIRLVEGRTLAEPVFPLLIAAEAGALAGAIAGYYNVRARMDARRAQTVTDALSFVNSLIRHDLRNDLNVIRGHAGLLDGESGDGDRRSETSKVIVEKSSEALARIETTRAITNTLIGEPDLEPVELTAVVSEMAAQVTNAFDVSVVTDVPDRASVTANAGLRSVVDNLLENAAEHNDADEPKIEIVVERQPNDVVLRISDNGPGIPDAQKETLFEPSEDGDGGGGLSLVRTLIEGYGGDIRIEDNDSTGTTFVVRLPRSDAAGSQEAWQAGDDGSV
ncbi:ATP-binding protein [Halobellus clavatus]|uniref:histidine kinase n=1 Tax=Halobellus clavatus TaxID=660517 RepID=A0A1H3DKZ2_9EURY|nr:ATP-binding protein [Halobellus clavatus]SDX67106.1 Signal transduction histidine kinase [Halobellus clavatus]